MIGLYQILIILLAVTIFSLTNHYDKYLINKYARDFSIGMLLIFSGLIGLPTALIIWLFLGSTLFTISGFSILLLVLSGFFYILSLVPYMYAIESDDVSTITPIFLIMPVITYTLSYAFLGEVLTITQVIAMFVVITGVFLISTHEMDENHKLKIKVKYRTLLLVLASSILNSSLIVFFKYAAIEENYFLSMFWNQLGYILGGFALLLVPSYRRGFLLLLSNRKNSTVVLYNFLGEIINIIGDFNYRYALILAPVTIVQTLALGFQPIFVFLLGIIFTMFIPWFATENISKKILIHKGILITIMCIAVMMI
jgi:drug/metabolite transporter (DMT)-like permease